MDTESEMRTVRTHLARDVLVILLMFAVIGGIGLAVLWPWRDVYRPEASTLARYAPSYDGWSALSVQADAQGRILLWHGLNRRHLRNAEGYATEISKAARDSIVRLYIKGEPTGNEDFVGLTRDAQFIQERIAELDPAGAITQTTTLALRNADGEYVVSLNAQDPNQEIIFSPPALFTPADLQPGQTWESAGQLGAIGQYTVTGEINGAAPYAGELIQSDECVQAQVHFQIGVGGQVISIRRWATRLCAGLGAVEEVETTDQGTVTTIWRTVSSSDVGGPLVRDRLPAPVKAAEAASGAASTAQTQTADAWGLTRIGRAAGGVNANATIAPTYVSTDPPLLLVASYEGDLIALDAQSTGPDPLWRFDPGGTVFGQPAFDLAAGRIYFGASDKRLYALDSRGLFIWAYLTGDNVATKPAIVGDLVIFGSEDRNAYAVEADTGRLRWQQDLGSALVAAPGLASVTVNGVARQVAIFGSDDGGVFGLDAATGGSLWQYDAGKAVEAPVVVDGTTAFIASTAGVVAALDAGSGEEQWTADLTSTHVVRYAVAVTAERVYAVDELGYLTALSRGDGRRIWLSREADYFGAPLAVGDDVFVGAESGVVRVGPDGARRSAWALTSVADASDVAPSTDFGPAAGGGALWLSDRRSVVWRIGPARQGPRPLLLAWQTGVNEPPFALNLLRAPPVQQADRLLALDDGGRLYRVDPQTGAAELQTTIEHEAVFVEPVIAGDLLITASNTGLVASRLTDGATAWRIAGGATFEPPVLAGDRVVWACAAGAPAAGGQATGVRIAAVETQTGALRWERTFPSATYVGGVAVRGNAVFATSPIAALDLQTGESLWEAGELTDSIGAPVLSADGSTVYAGRVTLNGGEALALDARTGAVRWQQPLPGNALSLLERPWVSGDLLIMPTLGGSVVGLAAADGALRWIAQLPAPRFGSILVADGLVYAGLLDGEMLILSAADGQIVARRGDREGGLETYARAQRPILQGNHVIMSFGSSLRGYALPEVAP